MSSSCVCVCVRACVSVCVRVCVSVCKPVYLVCVCVVRHVLIHTQPWCDVVCYHSTPVQAAAAQSLL